MAAGNDNMPRDAKTIIALLKSVGVDSYEPRVVRQFLDLYYRTAVDLLTDAKTYSNHAGKTHVDYADVRLAIEAKSYFNSTHTPPPEVKVAAMKVNSKPIPRPPTNQSSEAVEEREVEDNAVKIVENAPKKQVRFPNTRQEQRTNNLLPGNHQRVSFPLGLNRQR